MCWCEEEMHNSDSESFCAAKSINKCINSMQKSHYLQTIALTSVINLILVNRQLGQESNTRCNKELISNFSAQKLAAGARCLRTYSRLVIWSHVGQGVDRKRLMAVSWNRQIIPDWALKASGLARFALGYRWAIPCRHPPKPSMQIHGTH